MSTPPVLWTVTPSGSTVGIQTGGVDRHPDRDVHRHWFSVSSSPGTDQTLWVGIAAPIVMNAALQQAGLQPLNQVEPKIASLAAVRSVDQLQSLPQEGGIPYALVGAEEAVRILRPARPSDRDVRRWLARRLHLAYSLGTLNETIEIGDWELSLLGISLTDMLRSAQLLEAENNLSIASTAMAGLRLRPTAKLIRDVERFGAARDDAVAESDFLASLGAYSAIGAWVPELSLEFRRFAVATSVIELQSVFRAVAPIVEDVLKRLLAAHGSRRAHPSLGPAIQECTERGLGGVGLWAQLNHILKFARDLAQHGAAIPEPVVRIACANVFELVPQLAALFPPPGSAAV